MEVDHGCGDVACIWIMLEKVTVTAACDREGWGRLYLAGGGQGDPIPANLQDSC
jgi:hypothetical protein